ncbi:hypothetical protein [Sphaerothrix gracilis]|uniref:hypothetical protein n=1 Tax=Sphaerothrix gracilis TaxID=3151835 RepID=UPI0031FC04FC
MKNKEYALDSARCLIWGYFFIFLGAIFYLTCRSYSPALIAPLKRMTVDCLQNNFPSFDQSFPTFAHAAGFSFLSAAFLPKKLYWLLAVAAFWLLINTGYEFSCLLIFRLEPFVKTMLPGYSCAFDFGDIAASFGGVFIFLFVCLDGFRYRNDC